MARDKGVFCHCETPRPWEGLGVTHDKGSLTCLKCRRPIAPASTAPTPPVAVEALTIADYEAAFTDHRRLVRELDVLLNGESGAARQASLCDIVGQVADTGTKIAATPPRLAREGDVDSVLHSVTEAHRIYMHGTRGNAIEDHLMDAIMKISAMRDTPTFSQGFAAGVEAAAARCESRAAYLTRKAELHRLHCKTSPANHTAAQNCISDAAEAVQCAGFVRALTPPPTGDYILAIGRR